MVNELLLCILFYFFTLTDERKLAEEEMPLLVQLNWHKDDREGRFLLRRMDEKTYVSVIDCFSLTFVL